MITGDKKQLIQESLRTLAEKHSAAVEQLEQTIAVLSGVLEIDSLVVVTALGTPRSVQSPSRRETPRADISTLSVVWGGRVCFLGNTLLFRFFERLARSPNQYISHVDLLDDVWEGQREGSTIRGVAKRLRDRLTSAGMHDLAAAIDGSVAGYFGLNLV